MEIGILLLRVGIECIWLLPLVCFRPLRSSYTVTPTHLTVIA